MISITAGTEQIEPINGEGRKREVASLRAEVGNLRTNLASVPPASSTVASQWGCLCWKICVGTNSAVMVQLTREMAKFLSDVLDLQHIRSFCAVPKANY